MGECTFFNETFWWDSSVFFYNFEFFLTMKKVVSIERGCSFNVQK